MHMTFLGACPQTGLAADTIIRVGHRHDLVAHIVSILVFSFKRLFNELKHFSAAGLVTTAAAYAFVDID
jgi:hypothetical protein